MNSWKEFELCHDCYLYKCEKNVKQFKHEKWEAISKKAKYF